MRASKREETDCLPFSYLNTVAFKQHLAESILSLACASRVAKEITREQKNDEDQRSIKLNVEMPSVERMHICGIFFAAPCLML